MRTHKLFRRTISLLQLPHLHCASLLGPAIRKKSPLGGVAVKFAGFRNIFLLLPRHFRCIWGTGYAARAEVFPGDVVLSWPVFFACRWLHFITADAVHVVPCGCRNGATCSPQSRGNDPSCSHAARDPPARPASGLFSEPAAGRLSQALRRFVGRHILRSIFVCLRFLIFLIAFLSLRHIDPLG